MKRAVVVHDERGERRLSEADFPLTLGTGADAHIELPSSGAGEPCAFIGLAGGAAFVQPAQMETSIFLNGERLAESQWLAHGDVLAIGDARIACGIAATELRFELEHSTRRPTITAPREPPPQRVRSRGSRRTSAPKLALLVALAILLALVVFVFVATPVSVQITPPPDDLAIKGTIPAIPVGSRFLAIAGDYRIEANKAGYHPLNVPLSIHRGEHQRIELALQKLPGLVSIVSQPVLGAEVHVDGAPLGPTPLAEVEIAAGKHTVRVSAQRFLDAEATLDVEGSGKSQTLHIELVPDWAPVSVRSAPPGASVSLDGERVGVTPIDLEVTAGAHTLVLNLAAHDELSAEITVVANQPLELAPYALAPSDGIVALASAPNGASVTVDGEFRGRTPLELALAPHQEHIVRVSKAGFAPATRALTLEPGNEKAVSIELGAQYGTLFIVSDPADAELVINGKSRGPATQRLKLPTVAHELMVKKAGYEMRRLTVTPRAGASQQIEVALRPKEAGPARTAAPANTSDALTTAAGQVLKLVRPRSTAFRMGTSRREAGRRANENLRSVALTRAFYLSVKEVTNAEFKRFKPAHVSGASAGADMDKDEQPAVSVSWDDAAGYLNWLSEQEGLAPAYANRAGVWTAIRPLTNGYRLPTEAEWAYAARYGSGADPPKYPWGGRFPPPSGAGNYADTATNGSLPNVIPGYDDGFAVTAPVGSFKPNALGIFDLGGNVAEWCHDYYALYPDAANRRVDDPIGPERGKHHVVRGSSWRDGSISELRLTYRDYAVKPRPDLGFRIARYAE